MPYHRDTFKAMSVSERGENVKEMRLCRNCFVSGHRSHECRSKYSCRVCGSRHHSLLHNTSVPTKSQPTTQSSSEQETEQSSQNVVGINRTLTTEEKVISPTCQVMVEGTHGIVKTRALIDSGAHVSLASTRLAHTLKLPRRKHLTRLSGVAGAHTIDSHYTATIKLISADDPNETLSLTVVLLKNVLPDMEPIDSKVIRDDVAFKGLKLTDPDYYRAGKIDLLLGAGVRPWLSLSGSIVNKERTITTSQTLYGWMLEGNFPGRKCKYPSVLTVHTVSLDSEFSSLSKFWELEELPAASKLSPEEQTALDHFNSIPILDTLMDVSRYPYRKKIRVHWVVPVNKLKGGTYVMNALFSVKAPGISSRKKCRTTSIWVTLSRCHKKIFPNLKISATIFLCTE